MDQVYPVKTEQALGHDSKLSTGVTKRLATLEKGAVTITKSFAAGSAGADLTATGAGFYTVPTGFALHVQDVSLIALGTAAGIDDDNTCDIDVTDLTASKEVAAFLFDTDNAFPAADGVQEMTIDDHNVLPAGAVLGINVTQGATADHNGFVVQITGLLEKV